MSGTFFIGHKNMTKISLFIHILLCSALCNNIVFSFDDICINSIIFELNIEKAEEVLEYMIQEHKKLKQELEQLSTERLHSQNCLYATACTGSLGIAHCSKFLINENAPVLAAIVPAIRAIACYIIYKESKTAHKPIEEMSKQTECRLKALEDTMIELRKEGGSCFPNALNAYELRDALTDVFNKTKR